MIVDSMSLQEVGVAILKAAPKSTNRIRQIIANKEKDYRKVIIKGLKDRYDFKPITFTTDGIEFIVCPYSKGKNDYKRYGMAYCLFAHVFYRNRNWYCLITWNSQRVVMYCTHFFERYIERHLGDDSKVNVEIVRRYFKETDYLTHYSDIDNPKYENCIYGATNIGVCCGEKVSNNIIVYKTYIDMETVSKGDKRKALDKGQYVLDSLVTNELGIREFRIAV